MLCKSAKSNGKKKSTLIQYFYCVHGELESTSFEHLHCQNPCSSFSQFQMLAFEPQQLWVKVTEEGFCSVLTHLVTGGLGQLSWSTHVAKDYAFETVVELRAKPWK